MRAVNDPRPRRNTVRTACLSLALLLGLVLAICTASQSLATERDAKKPAGRDLDPIVARYLPDDCQCICWTDLAAIRRSKLGSTAWSKIEDIEIPYLPIAKVDRIVTATVAPAEPGGEDQEISVLYCSMPVKQMMMEASTAAGGVMAIAFEGRLLWTFAPKEPDTGKEEKVFCSAGADEDEVIVCGPRDLLRKVIKRNKAIALPERLERGRRLLDPTAQIAVVAIPSAAMSPASESGSIDILSPIAARFSESVRFVNLAIRMDSEAELGVKAYCVDNATAQELRGTAAGLLMFFKSLVSQDEAAASGREMLDSTKLGVDGKVFTAHMRIPPAALESMSVGEEGQEIRRATPLVAGSTTTISNGVSPLLFTQKELDEATAEWERIWFLSKEQTASPEVASQVPPIVAGPPSVVVTSPCAPSNPCDPWPTTGTPWPTLPVLPYEDVIRLTEADVAREVIIKHLAKHRLAAALTTGDLIKLTQSGVSTEVILALQQVPVAAPGQ